jgi:hypothetical protein
MVLDLINAFVLFQMLDIALSLKPGAGVFPTGTTKGYTAPSCLFLWLYSSLRKK